MLNTRDGWWRWGDVIEEDGGRFGRLGKKGEGVNRIRKSDLLLNVKQGGVEWLPDPHET